MVTQPFDSTLGGHGPDGPTVDFRAVRASAGFRRLRKQHRGFAFPVVLAALAWYSVYILLAAYAPAFMSMRVSGNITVGIVLGLSQIVTTFVIALAYVAYANRILDPAATQIRTELEARIDAASAEGAQA